MSWAWQNWKAQLSCATLRLDHYLACTATDTMNIEPNIEPNIEANIEPNIEPNIDLNIEPIIEPNFEPNN